MADDALWDLDLEVIGADCDGTTRGAPAGPTDTDGGYMGKDLRTGLAAR